MKKIVIFPLLDSLPSGHHQVANAITEYITRRSTDIECKKIDLLNSWNHLLEPVITKTYLKWIQRFPNSYAWIYKKLAYQSKKPRSYKHYDLLFQKKMEKILAEENPDLIICTHGFPSYLINNLKKSGKCPIPVVNVYTDFFINDVWGRERIDYHFVSDVSMKSSLVDKYHIPERKIFVTGVPIDERFPSPSSIRKTSRTLNVILSGGSAGLGNLLNFLSNSNFEKQRLNFYVLCGKNNQLYQELLKRKNSNIHPLPYLSSREDMNDLYNLADAIITKPGGVTVSEAIKKQVPIFVHSALPGQEEINLKHLEEKGLVFTVKEGKDPTEQILEILTNEPKMKEYQRSLHRYSKSLQLKDP